MKNPIPQLSIVIIALIALTFLMGYTRTTPDEPKQYILIFSDTHLVKGANDKFVNDVNQKLSEGWHLQGGVSAWGSGIYEQAMVK